MFLSLLALHPIRQGGDNSSHCSVATGAVFDPTNPRKQLKKEGSGVADDAYHRFEDGDGHTAKWAYLRLTATLTPR
jgi:hypothetical protein